MSGARPLARCALLALGVVGSSAAFAAHELDENERDVPLVYKHVGIREAVPYKLLYAVALVESGYRAPSNAEYRPWPWTLNFAGRAERFRTKAAALAALLASLEREARPNVDIGLAQINYRFNGELLPSIGQSLDPMTNLVVATRVLKRELGRCARPDWWCAIGRYHSPGPSAAQRARAERYTERVRALWSQLQ